MRDMTESELHYFYDKQVCPNCRGDEILLGPTGGMCQNVECSTCGMRMNVTEMPMFRFGQIISEPAGYVPPELPKDVPADPEHPRHMSLWKRIVANIRSLWA